MLHHVLAAITIGFSLNNFMYCLHGSEVTR